MEINLFFEGVDSVQGFQSSVLKEIDNKIHFSKCVLTNKCLDDSDSYDVEKYTVVDYNICEKNRYEDHYDFNDMLPLSRQLLEAMQPFESTAIKMFVRNYERDIYTYDECKKYYLNHLRFWNNMLITNSINFICFANIPHHVHDYIIYSLGQIYNIPTCLCFDTSIQPRLALGTSLENLWERSFQSYEEYRKLDSIDLPDDIEHYYQALLYGNKSDTSPVHRGMTKKAHIAIRKKNFTRDFERKNVYRRSLSYIKSGIKKSLIAKNTDPLQKNIKKMKQDLQFVRRGKVKLRSMCSPKYFDQLADLPDYNEKYIVFFMHLQPEATTLPQGGVFAEQELMIQILAHSAEKLGVKLYVKEHFVQPYRNKSFYEELSKIRNVRLIRTDVNSKSLAKHSVATASCNGTIVLESIFNGIPTFIFGNCAFRSAPGVLYIGDTIECDQYLEKILSSGIEIKQHDVRAFLRGFADNTIRAYYDARKYESDSSLSIDEGKKAYINYVVNEIQKTHN